MCTNTFYQANCVVTNMSTTKFQLQPYQSVVITMDEKQVVHITNSNGGQIPFGSWVVYASEYGVNLEVIVEMETTDDGQTVPRMNVNTEQIYPTNK